MRWVSSALCNTVSVKVRRTDKNADCSAHRPWRRIRSPGGVDPSMGAQAGGGQWAWACLNRQLSPGICRVDDLANSCAGLKLNALPSVLYFLHCSMMQCVRP